MHALNNNVLPMNTDIIITKPIVTFIVLHSITLKLHALPFADTGLISTTRKKLKLRVAIKVYIQSVIDFIE